MSRLAHFREHVREVCLGICVREQHRVDELDHLLVQGILLHLMKSYINHPGCCISVRIRPLGTVTEKQLADVLRANA